MRSPAVYLAQLCLLFFTIPQTTNATPVPSNDSSSSSDPILSLSYATYKGYHNTTSHIYQFRSVRFAASTANENRWRAAQPPADERGLDVQDASGWPKQCPQATAGGVVSKDAYDPLQGLDDEDCLFLSVWAPDGVVLNAGKDKESGEKEGKKTKEMDLLPVLVWIHGGGWDHNSVREFDHTPLLTSTNNSFIGISIQYRLGAFGFLADPAMAADGGLNAGITDARAALRWVQEYVHLLGGDRKRVTIWGQSSGGGTVGQLLAAEAEIEGMQMGANEKEKGKERKEVLFQGAMLSSPYMVPMGNCNDSFWKDQFEDFSRRAGCTNDLECLRKQDTSLLRTLNHEHYVNYTYSGRPSVYEPCIEGPGGYIQYNTVERILSGQVAGHAVIAGSNYADGSTFVTSASLQVPKNITDPAQVATQADTLLASVLMQKWPLTKDQAREAVSLYPLAAFKDNYERGGVVFTDAVFACASNWIADAYGNNGYRYLYAVADAVHARGKSGPDDEEALLVLTRCADLPFIDNAYEFPFFYNTLSPYSPSFYQSYIGSMTSFLLTAPKNQSPNTLQSPAIIESEGAWPAFAHNGEYKVLNLTQDASTRENVTSGYIGSGSPRIGTQERCDFWKRVRVQGGW